MVFQSSLDKWIADDFARDYSARILESPPYGDTLFEDWRDGLYVEVSHSDGRWNGKFPFGISATYRPCGLVACPDPHRILIAAGGIAYYVDVREPSAKVELDKAVPLRQVFSSRVAGRLFLAADNRVTVIDKSGVECVTNRLG